MIEVAFPIAEHNLHRPGGTTARRVSITRFLDHAKGGMGGFNEFNSADIGFMHQQATARGLSVYSYGTNGIVWDSTVVRKLRITPRLISHGGSVGADEVKGQGGDQKVGPNRYVLIGVFTPIKFNKPFEFDVTHMAHQAFTKMKWKAPLWFRSEKRLAHWITLKDGMLTGDTNRGPVLNLAGVNDVAEAAPPTFGGARYDKFVRWGDTDITNIGEFHTPSDHNGLKGVLHIYLGVGIKPSGTPVRPPIKSREKYDPKRWRALGAPVPHPFAQRTARWKRAHPAMWRKILAFQTKWKATHV